MDINTNVMTDRIIDNIDNRIIDNIDNRKTLYNIQTRVCKYLSLDDVKSFVYTMSNQVNHDLWIQIYKIFYNRKNGDYINEKVKFNNQSDLVTIFNNILSIEKYPSEINREIFDKYADSDLVLKSDSIGYQTIVYIDTTKDYKKLHDRMVCANHCFPNLLEKPLYYRVADLFKSNHKSFSTIRNNIITKTRISYYEITIEKKSKTPEWDKACIAIGLYQHLDEPSLHMLDDIYYNVIVDIQPTDTMILSDETELNESPQWQMVNNQTPFTVDDDSNINEESIEDDPMYYESVYENYDFDKFKYRFWKGRQPGWDYGSFGFHSDDGCIFHNSTHGIKYDTGFGVGDVVGCGLYLDTKTNNGVLFFTKNGKFLGEAFSNKKLMFNSYYPAVGIDSSYSIKFNFGCKKFVFDLDGFEASKVSNTIEDE